MLVVLSVCGLSATGGALAAGVWSAPEQVDHAQLTSEGGLVVCASITLCIGTGHPSIYHLSTGGTLLGATGVGLGSGNGSSVTALQCPSVSFCIGVEDDEENSDDGGGDYAYPYLVVSTAPTAGQSSFQQEDVKDLPLELSCPTAGFCAGAGQSGDVDIRQSMTGGSGTWTTTKLSGSMLDIDCPSTAFCAGFDTDGDVWTSTDPTGGASAWVKSGSDKPLAGPAAADAALNRGDDMYDPLAQVPENLACSGPDLCIATGSSGSVVVSADPAGPAAWSAVKVAVEPVSAVACVAGATLCLAGDTHGGIATSSDGAATWTDVQTTDSQGISAFSCVSQLCVASPSKSTQLPLSATVPTGTAVWQWSALSQTSYAALSAISCPTKHDCVATDSERYYSSANPNQGASSWRVKTVLKVPGDDIYTLSTACYSATGCLAVTEDQGNGLADVEGGSLYRFDPAGGAHAFQATHVGGDNDILYADCAQGTCVAGIPGHWFESSHPASNRDWRRVKRPHFDVTCLKGNASCVALDGPSPGATGADLLVAAHRGGPWQLETVDPGGQITGLACTSAGACVLVDQGGQMLVSTTPTAGPTAWHPVDTDDDGFTGVACRDAETCVAVDGNGRVVVGRP